MAEAKLERPPCYENIHINDIIEECAAAAQQRFESAVRALVTKELNFTKDILIEADPLQTKEVLCNILNSSYDAVPESGGRIEILTRNKEEFLEIHIKDNGAGIDKSH